MVNDLIRFKIIEFMTENFDQLNALRYLREYYFHGNNRMDIVRNSELFDIVSRCRSVSENLELSLKISNLLFFVVNNRKNEVRCKRKICEFLSTSPIPSLYFSRLIKYRNI